MKVRLQIEADLGPDSRTFANIEAALEDAADAVVERLGMDEKIGEGHYALRARLETIVTQRGETITVKKNLIDTGIAQAVEFILLGEFDA